MKNKIIRWIRQQVFSCGAKGIVLGLSGGVDSSLAASLAKEAVGKGNVLGLFLPCHSHSQDLQDARAWARRLGIKTRLVDLSAVYEAFLKVLPAADKLTLANLKPRLRMAALYYFANRLNYLVCGTGNKSELSVGYFTKYGDGAADILPLGALLKKDVRTLARKLAVPPSILDKAPTAGLWSGQTDEGEIGISYAELDDILARKEKGSRQVAAVGKVRKVKQMIQRSHHKRQGPMVCMI